MKRLKPLLFVCLLQLFCFFLKQLCFILVTRDKNPSQSRLSKKENLLVHLPQKLNLSSGLMRSSSSNKVIKSLPHFLSLVLLPSVCCHVLCFGLTFPPCIQGGWLLASPCNSTQRGLLSLSIRILVPGNYTRHGPV